eukprot:GFUD01003557.1.p1 GENE.GFUD01003557.1~~GFUD01003557.1.p1  ORF type:complete len:644 (+),score=186.12 GFUD01003557.1:81-2012(+)
MKKAFVDLFIKLSSFILFNNVEVEAFKKQVKNNVEYCHFDNRTCPLAFQIDDFDDTSVLKSVENYISPKSIQRRRYLTTNGSQIKNNTTSVPTYKEIMMNSAHLVKNKTICDEQKTENIDEEEKEKNSTEQDLEILLNEKEWKKNFASIECGAKLIKSSSNLKHPNHLINKNNDEYMMNECKDETYFIIELCEIIKVIRFELDNFELYSGTPKNFTVRTIDKYNNNLKAWTIMGNFEASSEKMEVQNFSDFEIKPFGKFIRVDINSFHGTEHFCTLTSLRVFGMTEYEYLSLTDDDGDDEVVENGTDTEEEVKSAVESRLHELDMRNQNNEALREQTTLLSYKYIFLQMRNDVCVDKVEFESFTKQGLLKNKDNIESIEYGTVEKKVIDVSQGKITDTTQTIAKKVQNVTKLENGNVSNTVTAPKESILVQISNRVKLLEKNFTVQNNNLKSFNASSKQQANDIDKILETILKAKEVFQETVGETEKVKGSVNDLNKKVNKFEETIGEYAEALKLMLAFTVFLSVLCLFLISLICFKPKERIPEVEEEEVEFTSEDLEVEVSHPQKSVLKDNQVQTDSPKIMKKVSFSDEEKEVTQDTSEDDISTKLTRRKDPRRKDPRRRVTWCGASFRKFAEDASNLVKEL